MNLLYQSLHVVGSLAKDIRAKERVLEIARVSFIHLISSMALKCLATLIFSSEMSSLDIAFTLVRGPGRLPPLAPR